MTTGKILLAEDDSAIRMVLNRTLTRAGYEVQPTGNLSTLWNWITRGEGDLLITDVSLPDGDAFDLMPKIRNLRKDMPIIVMSARNTFMTAIHASEHGAYDYLAKPFDINEMLASVSRALADVKHSRRRPESRDTEKDEKMPLVGRSAAMQEIYRVLARLMQTDLTVMITGESGTGKELVARALHQFGLRSDGGFVAINMAAIPRDLIESELFGYEKGAFTGAVSSHSGLFGQADGGTLFLDEIGDMPMDAQTRLLRVLQEGEFTPVGSSRLIATNARIIAATHQDLERLVQSGQFREDLFYRLNVVPIRLPPLRERLQDIGDLVHHFLKKEQTDIQGSRQISPGAIKRMQQYSWPGNIRELENFVRRLVALHVEETITPQIIDLELSGNQQHKSGLVTGGADPNSDLGADLERHLNALFVACEPQLPPEGLYFDIIGKVEIPLIRAALAACKGNQIKTARLLGLNRNTLRKKIQTHGIEIIRRS